MHYIAAQHSFLTIGSNPDADMAWRMTHARLERHKLVNDMVHRDKVSKPAFEDRRYAVLKIGVVRIVPSLPFVLPILELLGRKEVAGIWKDGNPPTTNQSSIPSDMVRVEMGAKYILDVFRLIAGSAQVFEIGPTLLMVALFVGPRFIITTAGVDKNQRS